MTSQRNNFIEVLLKESKTPVPLYCTGYPEIKFIDKYIKCYKLETNNTDHILNSKNFDIIKQMGFDAISLWDFRRAEGGYLLDDQRRVDGWGRIYKGEWYSWEGVFRNEKILEDFLNNRELRVLHNIHIWRELIRDLNENRKDFAGFLKKLQLRFDSNYFNRLIEINNNITRKFNKK